LTFSFLNHTKTKKKIKISKKDATKVPSRANFLSLKVLYYVKIGAILLPENVFTEEKYIIV